MFLRLRKVDRVAMVTAAIFVIFLLTRILLHSIKDTSLHIGRPSQAPSCTRNQSQPQCECHCQCKVERSNPLGTRTEKSGQWKNSQLRGTPVSSETLDHGDVIRQELYKYLAKFEFITPRKHPSPRADFVPDKPHLVIILGYQRTGSSFIGSSLFNDNPDAFFLFEPVDALYSIMYGVQPGWTIPSEITNFRENGSLRIPPHRELQAVAWYIDKLLSCDVDSMPYEVLAHKFWKDHVGVMDAVKPYVDCLEKQGTLGLSCQEHLQSLCGHRFGERDRHIKQDVCADYLWEGKEPTLQAERRVLKDYINCTHMYTPLLKPCAPLLRKSCKSKTIHAIKTVRTTMESMEELLLMYHNLRLIHLYRDPRLVVPSRLRYTWTLGNYERTHPGPASVARAYCQTVLQDYKTRVRLEKQFPGRIMEVVYDNFIKDPLQGAEEVYDFLNITLPFKIREKMSVAKDQNKWFESPMKLMVKYLVSLDMTLIQNECKEFAAKLGIKWMIL